MAMNGSDLPANDTGTNEPKIRRGRIDSLSVYEISEYELEILEKGSPTSSYFNIGTLFLSVGVSFLITVLTTEIKNERLYTFFVLLVLIGLLGGAALMFLWRRAGNEVDRVCKKIRDRLAD